MKSFFFEFALFAGPVSGFLSSTEITGKRSLKHHTSHRRHHRSQQNMLAIDNSTASTSQASTSHISQKVCQDSPSDWISKTGVTCSEYAKFKWCDKEGHYGAGWKKDFGSFEDWGNSAGRGAPEACCVCGGGMEMAIGRTDVGGTCSEGATIQSEQVCRDAARSIGAGFAMSAHWPIGQPTGCHTDGEGKQVWLNTSPKGTTPHPKYAVLCATDMKLRHHGADTEEAEEDDDASADDSDDDDDEGDEEGKSHEHAAVVRGGSHVSNITTHEESNSSSNSSSNKTLEDPEQAKLRQAVVSAHAALATNLKRRVEIGAELHDLNGNASKLVSIDARVAILANETESPVLAHFLGDMWKEQRRYEIPPYTEHLESEEATLEKEAVVLQAAYDAAKTALDTASSKEEAF